ncbi:hypothetical protein [Prauserella rugosa]|uniref:hypothetical protein n=1 Tax=Prauserella rugosa TaxID=43354 RepID=UPI0011A3A815|nr:hypothetical protein [Prauserella rugosa]
MICIDVGKAAAGSPVNDDAHGRSAQRQELSAARSAIHVGAAHVIAKPHRFDPRSLRAPVTAVPDCVATERHTGTGEIIRTSTRTIREIRRPNLDYELFHIRTRTENSTPVLNPPKLNTGRI